MKKLLLPLLVLMSSFTVTVTAQSQSPSLRLNEKRGEQQDAVRVHVVNVEVHVTDSKGAPIRGLSKADFELYENGKPVSLTNFFEAVDSKPTATTQEDTSLAFSASPQQASEVDEPINIVIFIDSLNLMTVGRRMVVQELCSLVENRLRPQDRITLLSYDTSLQFHCGPTTDRSVVVSALNQLIKGPSEGLFHKGPCVNPNDQMMTFLMQDLVNSLLRVVGALSELPGRTKLIYVSDGIPPLEEIVGLHTKIRVLAERCNSGRLSIYPINARPIYGVSSVATNFPGSNSNSVFMATSLSSMFRLENSLTDLATKTGGRTLFSEATIEKAFSAFTGDLATYYSLGFSPKHFQDGKLYSLKVRVKREGLKLRYRDGYYDRTKQEQRFDQLTAGMFFGGASESLGLHIKVGKPTRASRRVYDVPIEVQLARDKITLIRDGKFYNGHVTISITAGDERGATSKPHDTPFPIRLSLAEYEQFMRQDPVFTFTVQMKPLRHTLVVSAHDDTAQVDALATTIVTPGPPLI